MASAEYYRFIEKVRSRPKPENPSVEESRANLEKIGERMQVLPGTTFTPTDAGGVPAEWVAPAIPADERTILYTHGGGYNFGSIRTHRALTAGSRPLPLPVCCRSITGSPRSIRSQRRSKTP